MKKILLFVFGLLAIVQLQAQNGVAFNTTETSPDASAIIDASSTSQGILIPRVDIADLSTDAPITSPVTSLMVYNTNSTTGPGFFYWDGTNWIAIGGSGAESLNDLSDGITYDNTTFIGDGAGDASSTGDNNTGLGAHTLFNITSGINNTAIGAGTGMGISTGSNNIILGYNIDVQSGASSALNIGNTIYATSMKSDNVSVGIGNGNYAPDASAVLDIKSTTSGLLMPRMTKSERDLISSGSPATGLMIYQTDNTPGFYHYDGSAWVANSSTHTPVMGIGDLTDAKSIGTSYFFGTNAGLAAGNGSENTAIGYYTLSGVGTGSYNTALGAGAGTSIDDGSYNILIGYDAETSGSSANNELNIGDAIYSTGLRGSTAKVGIGNGVQAPNSTLEVGGSLSLPIRVGGTTILTADDYTYIDNASGTTTLPSASGIAGRIYIIKHFGGAGSTVATNGSETIDAAASISLGPNDFIQVQSDGANWYIIGTNM